MSTHINLKEEKIVRVHAKVERNPNFEFREKKVEIKKRLFSKPIETIIQSEGWYNEDGWHAHTSGMLKTLIEKGEYKMVNDKPILKASLVIITSTNNHYYEYFESDEAMDERLEKIRQETNCDFFCVGND